MRGPFDDEPDPSRCPYYRASPLPIGGPEGGAVLHESGCRRHRPGDPANESRSAIPGRRR
ncbi:hypothetical protein GCM10010371_36540 [Streptomyces subrutilus]|uniref:Uncharacterized protein n=1 Tax=Streptomyces subrutilus TaxID=36818 RepID=A0A918QYV2_9ACTN|nr:hypothetical protein GCM10010371_36540 [Streptomyces subrutilus]